MSQHRQPQQLGPGPARVRELLASGSLTDLGRFPDASNDTRLALVDPHGGSGTVRRAVHKPVAGERPLHDFPPGTLAGREVAAGVLDTALGFDLVPPTVMRDPGSPRAGSLQIFVEADVDAAEPVGVFTPEDLPADWEPVFAAVAEDDTEVLIAHARWPRLRQLALFDVLANNADRKASHIITGQYEFDPASQPALYAIDNGLCFHVEDKLRTVLWGFAGKSLSQQETAVLTRLIDSADELRGDLAGLLAEPEIDALLRRARLLSEAGTFPQPPADRYPIPWPPL